MGDVGELAETALVLEPIANQEFLGSDKAGVGQGDAHQAPVGALEQGCDLDRSWLARNEGAHQVMHGEAGVDDVFDE